MPRLRSGTHTNERVAVCIPARDEAERLPGLLTDLLAQTGVPDLHVVVVDDDSSDGTGEIARRAGATVARSAGPTAGWTGKAAACLAAADLAPDADVLVFLDADVRLAPGAIASSVAALRDLDVALVAPWPNQEAVTAAERRVQPLLGWSWAATLPVFAANRSLRPSTAVACGQFLVFDADAYRAIGGHTAVAAAVTDDLAIARVLRRHGRRTALVAAGPLARCRMYRDATELDAGYTRWLWSAHGSAAGSAAVAGTALAAFVIAPAGVVFRGSRAAAITAYLAAATSRLVARSIESGAAPTWADVVDAAAHPVSVVEYVRLTWRSHSAYRRGALTWKGRPLARAPFV